MFVIFCHHYPSIFTLFYIAFILSCINAAPAPSVKTFYSDSISFLTSHHCKMPEEIYIPFSSNSDPDSFDYFSTPLQKCQTDEANKENERAHVLCKEIFEVLQNITCVEYSNASLPKINSTRFSDEVCTDFSDLRNTFPKAKGLIAEKLTDKVICTLLCPGEYEELCKTLVWSYDVQDQIRHALTSKTIKEEENTDTGVSDSKDSNMKTQSVNNSKTEQDLSNENIGNNLGEGPDIPSNQKEHKDISSDLNSNGLNESVLHNSEILVSDIPVQPKENVITASHEKTAKDSVTKTITQSEKANNYPEVSIDVHTNELLDSIKNDQNINPVNSEGKDNTFEKETAPNVNSVNANVNQDINQLSSANDVGKTDQTEKTGLLQAGNPSKDIGDNNNVQINAKTVNSLPTTSDNELGNVDFQEQENENTVKVKTTNSKTDAVTKSKNAEKLKETETVISNIVTSEKLDITVTTMQITLEKNDEDQAQEDRDQEQYNDTENEGDYPKEYENQPMKDKSTEAKNSASITSEVVNLNGISNNFDPFLNARNNLGSVRDDVQIVPAFPEQEDSHFFFYFLSIVLILMAGYLIFHNKQKIIALIVEGRHERRRRSHGAGYKKLETK